MELAGQDLNKVYYLLQTLIDVRVKFSIAKISKI